MFPSIDEKSRRSLCVYVVYSTTFIFVIKIELLDSKLKNVDQKGGVSNWPPIHFPCPHTFS